MGKKSIFVLEDDANRQLWFLRRFFGHTVDLAEDVSAAFLLLKANHYDAIFLDHDLEFKHYGTYDRDDPNTGYVVAGYLAQNPRKQPHATIVVHSMNPSGSKRMLDVLRNHGIDARQIPFPQLRNSRIGLS